MKQRTLAVLSKSKKATMAKLLIPVYALCLVGCTNVLDKKFDMKSVKDDYAQIKEEYKDQYTKEELNALSDAFAGQLLGGGTQTYRTLIEGIHAKKVKYDADLKAYNEAIKKMSQELSVKFNNSEAMKGDYGIGDDYSIDFTTKNHSKKKIITYQGYIDVETLAGTLLDRFGVEHSNTMLSGADANHKSSWTIYENISQFYNTAFEKLKFQWVPETIIYDDGTELKAPAKPSNPLKGFLSGE
jgi:hypothetical protein